MSHHNESIFDRAQRLMNGAIKTSRTAHQLIEARKLAQAQHNQLQRDNEKNGQEQAGIDDVGEFHVQYPHRY